jgi:hypothetical protein
LAYLGNRPAESFASFERQVFTIVNSQTAYTLSHSVTNENDIRLVVNNVVQEPGSGKAYTASGTTLTLSAALTNGTDTMYCVFLGRALQTVNPPNASVGSAQVADSLISGKTALGATPADTDELLISDAGTLKRVDYSYLKSANTPAFYAYLGSNQSGLTDDANVKITIDTEVIDTDNCFASNKFTPTTAGKYLLYASINYDTGAASNLRACDTRIYKNGSAIAKSTFNFIDNYAKNSAQHLSVVVDANGSSDYFELYGQANTQNSGTWTAIGYSNSEIRTYFGGYKLIGV